MLWAVVHFCVEATSELWNFHSDINNGCEGDLLCMCRVWVWRGGVITGRRVGRSWMPEWSRDDEDDGWIVGTYHFSTTVHSINTLSHPSISSQAVLQSTHQASYFCYPHTFNLNLPHGSTDRTMPIQNRSTTQQFLSCSISQRMLTRVMLSSPSTSTLRPYIGSR